MRLTFDGDERWFVLEVEDSPGRAPIPLWIDLTLQRFDPARADARWLAEVVHDVRAELAAYLAPAGG